MVKYVYTFRKYPIMNKNVLTFHTTCKTQSKRVCFQAKVQQLLHCSCLSSLQGVQYTCKCKRELKQKKDRS